MTLEDKQFFLMRGRLMSCRILLPSEILRASVGQLHRRSLAYVSDLLRIRKIEERRSKLEGMLQS